MKRLAHFDVSSGLPTPVARLLARCALGLVCGAAMIGFRSITDEIAPGVGAFAFIYPAVLLATLYGRWEAGLVAYAVSFAWVLHQVLPLDVPSGTIDPRTLARVLVNGASALVVLAFAETFRSAVEHERILREGEIERRSVLLAELEHRTKNNFALVASLLELQKRREPSELTRVAFDDAIGRVRTFSEAYTHLAGEQSEGETVEMRPYLERLVARVCSALLPCTVTVQSRFAPISLPRETAVAIGLFTNEALTNCAKYAFPNGRPGTIEITLSAQGEDWQLVIRDDGAGEALPAPKTGGGIGSQLLVAFARQAKARHATHYGESGCEVSLVHEAGD